MPVLTMVTSLVLNQRKQCRSSKSLWVEVTMFRAPYVQYGCLLSLRRLVYFKHCLLLHGFRNTRVDYWGLRYPTNFKLLNTDGPVHSSHLMTCGRISYPIQLPVVHPKTQEVHGIAQTALAS